MSPQNPTGPHDMTDPAPDPKVSGQAALDALQATQDQAEAAFENIHNSQQARAAAFDLKTKTFELLTTVNQDLIDADTIDLQAAAEDLSPGIKDLEDLKTKIEAIDKDFAEAATILTDLGKAITALNAIKPI